MKTLLLSAVAATAITAAGAAAAADIPAATRAPPALAPAPQFSWTGCYLGGHVGLGAGHTQFRDTQPDGNIDGNTMSNRTAHTDSSGGVYGGQIGCDLQTGSPWVIGLQGTFSGANISGTDQDQFNAPWTLTNTIDWYATITGRVGWAINNVLLYGKGGAAWVHDKLEIENSGVFLGNPQVTRLGWTIGTGVEWAFAPNWSAFVEANYYSFGDTTSTFNFVPGFINMPTTINTKQNFETFTLGVNYRFSWGRY
jgi:outer membrane immunogenic protein